MIHGMTIKHQPADHGFGQFLIVLDQKIPHRPPSCSVAPPDGVFPCQASVSLS